MSANIDMTGGRYNYAALSGTSTWWDPQSNLGTYLKPGQSLEDWIVAAGFGWSAVKVPAYALVNGQMVRVENAHHIIRDDSSAIISNRSVTDMFQLHQPRHIVEFTARYVSADPRFEIETAGSLEGGSRIWILARFNGDVTVAGARHQGKLLSATAFDGSNATVNKMTMVCVVCANTLAAALCDGGKSIVRTRHNTRFDPARAGKELAALAQSVEAYKQVGDAMAMVEMDISAALAFFKELLDIPADVKPEDVSTRKLNQLSDLGRAWQHANAAESADCPNTVWTALNSVTRFVDHDRATRGGNSPQEARALSVEFGSGAAMKGKAMELLMPRIKDRVPVLAN